MLTDDEKTRVPSSQPSAGSQAIYQLYLQLTISYNTHQRADTMLPYGMVQYNTIQYTPAHTRKIISDLPGGSRLQHPVAKAVSSSIVLRVLNA